MQRACARAVEIGLPERSPSTLISRCETKTSRMRHSSAPPLDPAVARLVSHGFRHGTRRHSNTAKTRASISCPLDSIRGLTERAGKPRRDDEDDEYDGPRDELRYAAVQLCRGARGLTRELISRVSKGRTSARGVGSGHQALRRCAARRSLSHPPRVAGGCRRDRRCSSPT